MAIGLGSAPSTIRLYSAGTSFRRLRSPIAPKMTSAHGSAVGSLRIGRPGISSTLIADAGWRYRSCQRRFDAGVESIVRARRQSSLAAAARSTNHTRTPDVGSII